MQVYLVQRRALRDSDGCEGVEDAADHPGDGFVPWKTLRMFASEAAALAFADEVLAMARLEVDPFQYCGWELAKASTHAEDDFWLLAAELGLPLAGDGLYARYEWWPQNVPRMTDAQREGVWALFDRLELVRVVPLWLDESPEVSP